MLPVGFGDQSRQFAKHMRKCRQTLDPLRPGVDIPTLDPGLREMIEHKPLAREAFHKLGGDRKMFGVNQDVVGEIEFLQRRNAAQEFRLQQEATVRFTLYHVTDTDKFWISRQDLQL